MLSMTHQSKNLFNICNWLVRQVVSAYQYDRVEKVSRLKAVLHPSQVEAIAHFNSQIDVINCKRVKNHPAKVEKRDWPMSQRLQVKKVKPKSLNHRS